MAFKIVTILTSYILISNRRDKEDFLKKERVLCNYHFNKAAEFQISFDKNKPFFANTTTQALMIPVIFRFVDKFHINEQ